MQSQRNPEGVDDVGASAGADDDCGAAEVSQSEKFWADVGVSPSDPTCIVGGDGTDRGELAGGGIHTMGATMAWCPCVGFLVMRVCVVGTYNISCA